jgi:glutamate N-acetyltransferase/amino-acid N-acetyltransferase
MNSAQALAQALTIAPESVLLGSTGVIGQRIPMDALLAGIPQLVEATSELGSNAAAQAIITTDLVTKSIALETTIDDRPRADWGDCQGFRDDSPKYGNTAGIYYL